jgi:hypothetical protein
MLKNNLKFDWIATILSSIMIFGLYYDIWFHAHFIPEDSNTFFTPTHYIFYGGFLLITAFLTTSAVLNYKKEKSWTRLLPPGYEISGVGAILFILGGIFDYYWHSLFGIEQKIAALLSPSHLILVTAVTLITSGPIRSAWRQPKTKTNFFLQLPMIISLVTIFTLFEIMSQFIHPVIRPYASYEYNFIPSYLALTVGIGSILFQTILVMTCVIFFIRKWSLLPGSLTLLFSFSTLILSTFATSFNYQIVLMALLSGIICDMLLFILRPSSSNQKRFYLFSFLLPIILNTGYFIGLGLPYNIWWSTHIWSGTILLSGLYGFLLCYFTNTETQTH